MALKRVALFNTLDYLHLKFHQIFSIFYNMIRAWSMYLIAFLFVLFFQSSMLEIHAFYSFVFEAHFFHVAFDHFMNYTVMYCIFSDIFAYVATFGTLGWFSVGICKYKMGYKPHDLLYVIGVLSLVENLFVKKFFTRFALQSEYCNFNQ